jgi:hypothetical protein
MIINDEEIKRKANQLKINELKEPISQLLLLSMFSVIGAFYAKSTGENIFLCICCPWGFAIVAKICLWIYQYICSLFNLLCLITVGFIAIICLVAVLYISCYVGIIAFPILFIYYIVKILSICKYDYIAEVNKCYNCCLYSNSKSSINQEKTKTPINQVEKNRLIKEYSKPHTSKKKVYNNFDNYKSEEFYCERCLKKISEDEYEMNDCMCEDCYTDVHLNDTDF